MKLTLTKDDRWNLLIILSTRAIMRVRPVESMFFKFPDVELRWQFVPVELV